MSRSDFLIRGGIEPKMNRTKWVERKFDFSGVPVGVFLSVLERLRGTPARLEELARGLAEDVLTARHDGAWSIKEQVGHLFDLDELHEGRLEDYRERREVLRAADMENRKTYEANHNAAPVRELLASFRAARARFVSRLEEMDEEAVARTARHPRLGQPMRVIDMALFVAEHDDHHLASVTEIIKMMNAE